MNRNDSRFGIVRPRLLAEGAVICVSVFVALAADAWWEAREEEAAEASYVALLQNDLERIAADLEEHVAFEDNLVRLGLEAYRGLSSMPTSDREDTSSALQRLMVRRTLVPRDGTYRDLVSTGNLRLIDNMRLRNRVVDYFENLSARYQIVNKNTAVFVDELYNGTILREGLVLPRSTGNDLEQLRPVEAMLAEKLRGGFVSEPDRLWHLPPDGPEWASLKATLLMRLRIAAYHSRDARELLERTRELQDAVAAERTG